MEHSVNRRIAARHSSCKETARRFSAGISTSRNAS
jgi:hypothetical protein